MLRENQKVSVRQYLEKSEERRKQKAEREARIAALAAELRTRIFTEESARRAKPGEER